MSSLPPPKKPWSLRTAERIHHITGKELLPRICVAGFLLECLWHSVMERRVLNTPAPAVRKALVRAMVTWPAVFVGTSASIYWAAWRVGRAESEKDRRNL
ncbi:hypothetical protein NPX13_g10656 [Xylaria arbuscula]|uniref:Uncharacterized protein n=1 Tax=Xylaria arbuscula TaxID=114810 RepID=A0A9W8TGD9_9PEZI|nr:hypothetical protein NPX13_g10656 [Xylaria arbuscula]